VQVFQGHRQHQHQQQQQQRLAPTHLQPGVVQQQKQQQHTTAQC
jgi:hypothetical protein